MASPPPPRLGCSPQWISSERFLSIGFHSSRAIPTQWIPHLPWALLLWVCRGGRCSDLGDSWGVRLRGGDSPFGPSWEPQLFAKIQSFSILSLALGLGSLPGRGWRGGRKKKKKKTQETENREDRDKRNNAKAKTGFFLKRCMYCFLDKSFHLFIFWRFSLERDLSI